VNPTPGGSNPSNFLVTQTITGVRYFKPVGCSSLAVRILITCRGCLTPSITNSVVYNGTLFAVLSNALVRSLTGWSCPGKNYFLTLPLGWTLSEDNEMSKVVIQEYPWSTGCVCVLGGVCYAYNGHGCAPARFITDGLQGYSVECPRQILIQYSIPTSNSPSSIATSVVPSHAPSATHSPTTRPSLVATQVPSTFIPTAITTSQPSPIATPVPFTFIPTGKSSPIVPSECPSVLPLNQPSFVPSLIPQTAVLPSKSSSNPPTKLPTLFPTEPTSVQTSPPTRRPTNLQQSHYPSTDPTFAIFLNVEQVNGKFPRLN
jgi:hypothetical protein